MRLLFFTWRPTQFLALLLSMLISEQGFAQQQVERAQLGGKKPETSVYMVSEYLVHADRDLECNPEGARIWAKMALDTASSARETDPAMIDTLGDLKSQSNIKIVEATKHLDLLNETAREARGLVKQAKLETARGRLHETDPKSCYSGFKSVRSEIDEHKSKADTLVKQGDAVVDRKPKEAIKFYASAREVDAEYSGLDQKTNEARNPASRIGRGFGSKTLNLGTGGDSHLNGPVELNVAEQWIRIATPDFELYTTAGEKAGREAIELFEQVRGFFLKASPVRSSSDFPVRIVVFKSPDQFGAYSLNGVASAYSTSDAMRDYIVMSSVASADLPTAIREYMHLVVRHSGLKLPVWLNEGWADVYSTLRPIGTGIAVGDLLPARMLELNREQWFDFDSLTSVDQHPPIYNESARAGIFYAESWALTHMLYLSPEYKDNFGKFVLALNSRKNAAEALQIAWGRTPVQVFADLHGYFDRNRIFGRVFETTLQKAGDAPVLSVLPDFDARLSLADLLAAVNKLDGAKSEYDLLAKEQPGRPEVAGSLGYLAMQQGDRAGARAYFEQALSAGTADAQLCLTLDGLQREAGQPAAKRIAALERAVQVRPDYNDARLQLGLAQVELREFPAAIATLMKIPKVTPERATSVYSALAFANLQTGNLDAARHDAETALKWVRTPVEKDGVDQLMKLIAAQSTGVGAAHPGEGPQ